MPRLKLAAAAVFKLVQQTERELELPTESTTFWTDSMIVMHSMLNSSKRFQTFFASGLATIHEAYRLEQWRYVDTNTSQQILYRAAFLSTNLGSWIDGYMALNLYALRKSNGHFLLKPNPT
ncbi:hypothetical protein EG68_11485 [Paragonimus skrjabini miyazakii]|uniref:Uncharacterized protein n=1 Tax=Paragonimus skrjabini miyazakii TaxID=59628 RepID=A0A8S9YDT8_9TREM|nr:hypothetical protein EG68_11485 [Paragonimus skrjabini miyazakii]